MYLVNARDSWLLMDMFTLLGRVKIFWLQESTRNWIKVQLIGDLVIFLSNDVSFACSVTKLGVDWGSCLIFLDGPF